MFFSSFLTKTRQDQALPRHYGFGPTALNFAYNSIGTFFLGHPVYKVSHTSHTCLRKDSNPIPPIDELLTCNNYRFFDWLQDNQKLFVNENSSSQSSLELTSSSTQPKFPRLEPTITFAGGRCSAKLSLEVRGPLAGK